MFYNVGISLHRKNMTLFTLYSTMTNNVMSVNQYNDQHVGKALDTMYCINPVLWGNHAHDTVIVYFQDD